MSVGEMVFEVKPKDPVKVGYKGSQDKPCIVLTSMIKNESKIIERMLDSAAVVASHFCVVDTGSTDNTLDVIKAWAEKRESFMSAYSIPFTDFGTTRTATLRAGAEWARKLGLDMDNTYLLLLDGDMILEASGFEASQLKDDNYRVEQYHNLAYFNVRLVRASKVKRYIGRTHEYLETSGKTSNLYTLRIKDIGDGGCKADKFERDVRLLEKDLEEDPLNPRSMYYLASSYESLGRHADAIAMYSRRIAAPNSWEEETWMAIYRRGITRAASGDHAGAAKDYADAWARRPWRAEPLAKLASLALNQGQHQKACAVAKAGISIPYPKGDSLFIDRSCYNDEFHQVLAIADYYTGGNYNGAEHCDHLILKGSSYCRNALQNAVWHMKPINASRTINLGEVFKDAIPEGQKPCNPSIIRHFDPEKDAFRYSLSIRTVNYSHRDQVLEHLSRTPEGHYIYPGDHIRTTTLHCELDEDLKRVSARALENAESRPNARFRGIEDVRLYQDRLVDGNTYGIGGRSDGPEDSSHIFACVWKSGKLVSCRMLSESGRREKNWLPIMNQYVEGPQAGPPRLLYNTWPDLTILDGTSLRPCYKQPLPINLYNCRGGSNVIRYLGGWLWVIHQVTVLPGMTKRKYLHRLCWSRGNREGPTVDGFRTTLPFCFEKAQIEFCCGASVGPGGSLLLTYGVQCNNAFLAVIDQAVVASMLKV